MSDHIGFIWPVWERERIEESSLQAAKSKLTKSRKTQREKHDVNMVKMKYTDDVEAKWITNARWWGMLLKWHKNFVTIFTEAIILLMKLLPHIFFLSLALSDSVNALHAYASPQHHLLWNYLFFSSSFSRWRCRFVSCCFFFICFFKRQSRETSMWHLLRINHWNLRNHKMWPVSMS